MSMKNLFLCILVMAFIPTITVLSEDFRKITWGDSIETVIQLEGSDYEKEDLKDGTYLFYNREFLEKKVKIYYRFVGNKVVSGNIVFHNTKMIDRLTDALTQKYGKGEFVSLFITKWLTADERTTIYLRYEYKNNETFLFYYDYQAMLKEYQAKAKKDSEQL